MEPPYPADDKKTLGDLGFESDMIVPNEYFTDPNNPTLADIETFLLTSPYKRPSFLAGYISRDQSAAASISRASIRHGISPLALLVFLQVEGALISEQHYPSPSTRVEYVFGYGCASATDCEAALAGLDIQLDSLARELRKTFDQLEAGGQSPAGFWVGKESVTLDGKVVVPSNAATATIYDRLPIVNKGGKGAWLFWNLWQKYLDWTF